MVRWLYDWPRKCHEYINNFTLDLLAKKEGVKSQKISHSVCKLPAIILRQDKQQHLLMQNSLQRIDESWYVKSVTINIQQRLIDTLFSDNDTNMDNLQTVQINCSPTNSKRNIKISQIKKTFQLYLSLSFLPKVEHCPSRNFSYPIPILVNWILVYSRPNNSASVLETASFWLGHESAVVIYRYFLQRCHNGGKENIRGLFPHFPSLPL